MIRRRGLMAMLGLAPLAAGHLQHPMEPSAPWPTAPRVDDFRTEESMMADRVHREIQRMMRHAEMRDERRAWPHGIPVSVETKRSWSPVFKAHVALEMRERGQT